jgi:hypothetical protein
MKWILNNWIFVSVVTYAIASEVIGMLPIKSNSVVQLVVRVIGRIGGRV